MNKSSNAAATSSVFFSDVVAAGVGGVLTSLVVVAGVLNTSWLVDCSPAPSSLVGFNHPSNTDFNSS